MADEPPFISYPIRCSRCGADTGAHFAGGDPYLPLILCTPCAKEAESG